MSLAALWKSSVSDKLWAVIENRYRSLELQPKMRLIRKNLDRECACDDIDAEVWTEFLRELAGIELPTNCQQAIDTILGRRRQYYFLPGKIIDSDNPERLFHYMRLGRFAQYNLKDFAIPQTAILERMITEKRVSGVHLEDNVIGGVPQRPVWVTTDVLGTETSGDRVRNALGMRHVDSVGDSLVEVSYPLRFTRGIHAPTFIDACWRKASDSWIFRKRDQEENPMGPKWGTTIDMSDQNGGTTGSPEAVHAPFLIRKGNGSEINLRVLEAMTVPVPEMNCDEMEKR